MNTARTGADAGRICETDRTTGRRRILTLAIAGLVVIAARSRRAFAMPPANAGRSSANGTGGTAVTTHSQLTPASPLQDLKAAGPQNQITVINHHQNTFEVTTADGRTAIFHEIDLRIKIDTSEAGPLAGRPVILPAGMMGDRVTVFFASPAEIGMLVGNRT